MSGYPGGGYPGAPGAPPNPYPGGAPHPSGYGGQPGGYGGQPGGYGGQPGGYGGQPGGYGGQPGGYGAPPVDPQIAQWFNAVDQDRSGQIDAKELQKALVNGNWSNFSEEACRMMIDMYDANGSGTIDATEFGQLFSYFNQWKAIYEGEDKDKSGLIDQDEFTRALEQMGYRFSPTFVGNLLVKFDPRGRRLTLDNFIVSSIQIKRLTDSFRNRDQQMRGQAEFSYEDFVGVALGAHK